MLKLHKLFDTVTTNDTFFNAIKPTVAEREKLIDAKNAIRDHLRADIEAASVTVLGMPKKVTPKFRTQGSWSYRTCVRPAQQPPQEMDWDFGVYLPVELWQEAGPPEAMALAYYQLVEKSLERLCKDRGWKLAQGKAARNTCIRVQIDSTAHIDIPLYAAPAAKFAQIVEASMLKATVDKSQDTLLHEAVEYGELVGQEWDDLLDDIYMAMRDGKWKKSDPAQVARWYQDRLRVHGEQLQRICMYLKAWRDFTWSVGGPSSVLIMIAVSQGFKAHFGRDDLVLEAAALRLSQALLGQVREPGIDEGEEDFNQLTNEERVATSAAAQKLAKAVANARTMLSAQKAEAILALRSVLGNRVPYNLDAIEVETSGDKVREVPAQIVAAPVVKRTEAG